MNNKQRGYAAYDTGVTMDVFIKNSTGQPIVGRVCESLSLMSGWSLLSFHCGWVDGAYYPSIIGGMVISVMQSSKSI